MTQCYRCGHPVLEGQKSLPARVVHPDLFMGVGDEVHINFADCLPTLMGSPMTETIYQVWRGQVRSEEREKAAELVSAHARDMEYIDSMFEVAQELHRLANRIRNGD